MPRSRATILVPFDSAGQRVRDAIARALADVGVDVFRLDDIQPGASWINAITDAIETSDFLVFDVTRHNPNVYYELGYAHALRKPTILFVAKDAHQSPPSDLQGHLYIVYDFADLRTLVDRVKRAAERYPDREGGHMKPGVCFVMMPFRAELNFFFLYLQRCLRDKHALHVERGDHRVLTKPLMQEVREQIRMRNNSSCDGRRARGGWFAVGSRAR